MMLPDGRYYVCGGDSEGAPVFGPEGQSPQRLGLNSPPVAAALRRLAFPEIPTGAAHLRWRADVPLPAGVGAGPFGVLVYLRQTVRADHASGWAEVGSALRCFVVPAGGDAVELEGVGKGQLLRGLFTATVRAKPETDLDRLGALANVERLLLGDLWRPSQREMSKGLRHAVTPLLAAAVESASPDRPGDE